MTAPTLPDTTPGAPTAAGPRDEGACPACPHPLTDHDAIGLRYCSATPTAGPGRGCVCRVA